MDKVTNEPYVLGVDVGGTKILAGLVSASGIILEARRCPMDASNQESVLATIDGALADFFDKQPGPHPLAIGIGLVGQTDPSTGAWVQAINLPIRSPVPLAARLGLRYGLPVALDNDVHAATLAELRWGGGQEYQDFIYLNVGTGLAAGLVSHGHLVRGAGNYAGEMGHMAVEPDGDLCTCGQRGCLEPLVSGAGLLAQVRLRLPDYPASPLAGPARSGDLSASQVFQAAEAGDPLAGQVASRAVRALSIALTGLIHLLNPEAILYGGGVVKDGWLMERVSASIQGKLLPAARRSLKGIWLSPLPADQVGLLGAASLAWAHIDLSD